MFAWRRRIRSSALECGAARRFCFRGEAFSIALVTFMLAPIWEAAAQFADEADSVLVVYNARMEESREVAEHYAKRRRVPEANLLGLRMARLETVSRSEYRAQVEEPTLEHLVKNGLFTFEKLDPSHALAKGRSDLERVSSAKIRYLVLCYGTPLRIKADPGIKEEGAEGAPEVMRRNEAAVDSELAALPLKRMQPLLSGLIPNPVCLATNSFKVHPTNGVLIVTRLDGPSKEIAKGLVDKGIEAEENGFWGRAYFDARGLKEGPYKPGDDMILRSSNGSRVAGFECVVDDQEPVFGDGFWMDDAAIYLGWYRTHVCGPFATGQVNFMPGAIAYHLHSFSAATVRNAKQHWVGPLLDLGATATFGYVWEPYLGGTVVLPKFMERIITRRFNFGEAAYSSIGSLSWMTTFVGDPLYRPNARMGNELHGHLMAKGDQRLEWSVLRFVDLQLAFGGKPEAMIELLEKEPVAAKSAVLQEKLGELRFAAGDFDAFVAAYEKALKQAPSRLQKGRLLETLATRLEEAGRRDEAKGVYGRLAEAFSDHPKAAGWRKRQAGR